jgi:hypothetical protein
MKFLRSLVGAAATAAILGACAPATEQAELGAPETRTTLLVENHNWSDMVIYLVRGVSRARLGSVPSMGTAKFQITDGMAGGSYSEVRIMADPIGSQRTFTSPVINVVPGSQVELRLENNLAISSYSVF